MESDIPIENDRSKNDPAQVTDRMSSGQPCGNDKRLFVTFDLFFFLGENDFCV